MCLVASMKMMEGCIPKRFEFCWRDDSSFNKNCSAFMDFFNDGDLGPCANR
jgi:hypothetical protein